MYLSSLNLEVKRSVSDWRYDKDLGWVHQPGFGCVIMGRIGEEPPMSDLLWNIDNLLLRLLRERLEAYHARLSR